MKSFLFALLLFIPGETFPTYSKSEIVKIYEKTSKFKQFIALDFLNNKDEISMIKLHLENAFNTNLEKSRVSILFQLINWITNFFEKITIANPEIDISGENVKTFNIFSKLRKATLDFIQNKKKRTVPEFLESFAENGEPIDKSKVIGCSNSILVGKNRIPCLKKFFKLVKRPIASYIGTELLDPLIHLLNLQISPLKKADIIDFARLLGFTLRSTNIEEELLNKIISIKSKIPTPEYLALYQIINSWDTPDLDTSTPTQLSLDNSQTNTQADTQLNLQSNLQTDTLTNANTNTMTDTQTDDNTETLTQTSTESHLQTDRDSEIAQTMSDSDKLDEITAADLYNKFQFLLSEISENEQGLTKMNSKFEKLDHIEGELAGVSSKINKILSDLENSNVQDNVLNSRLVLLANQLEQLKLSDSTAISSPQRNKLEELEQLFQKMLLSHQAKSETQNGILEELKSDIDKIKDDLSSSISMFNNDKRTLIEMLTPLTKLNNEVEDLKNKLKTINTIVPNIIPDSRPSLHEMTLNAMLLDVLDEQILELEHIKLLMSKPKETKNIPSFLNDMQIKYVEFKTVRPNVFKIEWEYYDELSMAYIINPIPICNKKECYYFTTKGYGNNTSMFVEEKCINIIEDEYFCKEGKTQIDCPTYSSQCERLKTVNYQPPQKINNTHVLLYTLQETEIMSKMLPNFVNILLSFKEDITFNIEDTVFSIEGFEQEVPVQVVQLIIDDDLWSLSVYNIFIGILSFAISSGILTLFAFCVIRYKRRNETQMVRINQSRVYFDPECVETTL